MGTGDFTVEAWVFLPSVAIYNCVVSLGKYTSGAGVLRVSDAAKLQWYFNDAGVVFIESTATVSANTWTHVAAVRSSGTTKLYINGVNSGSSADTSNYTSTYATLIGAENQTSPANYLSGYISNARVVKNTAVYTSNFTPSTTPLTAISGTSLLTCQSNRFIDNSSNAFAATANGTVSVQRFSPFAPSAAYNAATVGGSGYFDGSGDYLSASYSANLDLGSGNFTIETWIYPQAEGGKYFLNVNGNASTYGQVAMAVYGTAKIEVDISTGNNSWAIVYSSPNNSIMLNAWNHVALVRQGSAFTLYLNGVGYSVGSTASALYAYNGPTCIGYNGSASYVFNGYIADTRIVKGTALYTGNFTPPNAPLTAVANTQLLLNYTNAGIFDNAMMNDIETVGNTQISTSVKKWGTGALYFDGTGDWLLFPSSKNFEISGDATIEFWLYVGSLPSSYAHLYTSTGSTVLYIYLQSSGNIGVQAGGGYRDTTTAPIFTNTWYHVAITKTGGNTYRVYVNGISQTASGSGTMASSIPAGPASVGASTTGGAPLNGYIDDFRITNGATRYTANFTPPDAAFPNR